MAANRYFTRGVGASLAASPFDASGGDGGITPRTNTERGAKMSARRSNRGQGSQAPAADTTGQVEETTQVEETGQVEETAAAAAEQVETGQETPADDTSQTPADDKAEETPVKKPRAAQKLNWENGPVLTDKGESEGVGKRNGNTYTITADQDPDNLAEGESLTFSAYHQVDGSDEITELATGVGGAVAWRKCVDHHNAHYIAPVVETPADEATESEPANA